MKSKIKKLFKDDLILHTAIVFCGTTLAGVFNLLYHLISVRLLTPEDYGTFNALISLVVFASIPMSPLGTTLTRFFTEYITKQDFSYLKCVFMKFVKRILVVSFIFALFFFAGSSLIAGFLKTQKIYIFVCGIIIILSSLPLPIVSLFQSLQKFKSYSLIGIVSSFGKLFFGSLFMLLGWKVLGALLGFAMAPAIVIIVGLVFISNILKKEFSSIKKKTKVAINLRPIYKYFIPVSVMLLSFTILTNIDVVLIKHFFSPSNAGYYSIAQIVGKIALFLPSALAIIVLPKSTKALVNSESPLKMLYKSLIIAGIFCFIFTCFSFIFPEFLLRVLTGKVNLVSGELVGIFSLAMSFYALVLIIINFLLGSHDVKVVLPLLFISLLQGAVIYIYHPTLLMVLYIILVFSVISLSGLLAYINFSYRQKYG